MIELNKIYCENNLETMARMPDCFTDAIIADPRYGIDYQSAWRTDKATWKPKLAGDDKPCIEFLPEAFRVSKDASPLVVFCEWRFAEVFRLAIQDAGFVMKSQVIWDRVTHGMGDLNGAFAPCHDIAWFASKGAFKFPSERPTSVLRFPRVPADQMVHPTEKPFNLIAYLLRVLTVPDALCYDPFMGSGTLAVAAHKLKRQWIGSELSQDYVDVANRRLAPHLGQATLF